MKKTLLVLLTVLASLVTSLLASLVVGPSPASAAVAAVNLGGGASTNDLAAYTTTVLTPPADGLLLLYVTSGRTDNTAVAPTTVAGLGATWTMVATVRNKLGSLDSTLYEATDASAPSAITVTFPSVQQNFSWQLEQAGPAADAVVQSVTAVNATTAPSATLTGVLKGGSATFGFVTALSTTQTLAPGTGYAALGSPLTSTAPAEATAAEWRPDGQAKAGFTASGSATKTVLAVEVSDASYVPPYVVGPTVAVIGDSLTYQNGLGAANIASRLAADGYDSSHTYIDGVGGKALVKPDTTGETTLQNIADARARLGHVDTWVIALGTNDVSESDAVLTANNNAVLDAIGSTDQVVWVGLAFYRSNNAKAAHDNPLLAADAALRPNVRFSDWNSVIHNGRDETGLWVYPTDSTHMTDAGYAIRDDYYVSLVPPVVTTPPTG